jgi:putative oxidoreductase
LDQLEPIARLLVRVGFGLLLALNHGWGKASAAFGFVFLGQEWRFVGVVGEMGFPLPAFFAICAALAEFVGGLLLAAGLFTRYAAAFVTINMSVAVLRHLFTNMRYELAALYLIVAVYLLLSGAGKLSLDAMIKKARAA